MPFRPLRMRHANGTATTDPTKVSVNRGVGMFIRISNLDETNSLEISFDNGKTYYTVKANDPPLQLDAKFYFFKVKSNTGSVDYSAVIGEG